MCKISCDVSAGEQKRLEALKSPEAFLSVLLGGVSWNTIPLLAMWARAFWIKIYGTLLKTSTPSISIIIPSSYCFFFSISSIKTSLWTFEILYNNARYSTVPPSFNCDFTGNNKTNVIMIIAAMIIFFFMIDPVFYKMCRLIQFYHILQYGSSFQIKTYWFLSRALCYRRALIIKPCIMFINAFSKYF